mgnify:CR=1 FL=1
MQNRVFVVSRFEKIKGELNQFHFIGFYKGTYIKKILVEGGKFVINEDYVIAIDVSGLSGTLMYGKHIKSKRLFI